MLHPSTTFSEHVIGSHVLLYMQIIPYIICVCDDQNLSLQMCPMSSLDIFGSLDVFRTHSVNIAVTTCDRISRDRC